MGRKAQRAVCGGLRPWARVRLRGVLKVRIAERLRGVHDGSPHRVGIRVKDAGAEAEDRKPSASHARLHQFGHVSAWARRRRRHARRLRPERQFVRLPHAHDSFEHRADRLAVRRLLEQRGGSVWKIILRQRALNVLNKASHALIVYLCQHESASQITHSIKRSLVEAIHVSSAPWRLQLLDFLSQRGERMKRGVSKVCGCHSRDQRRGCRWEIDILWRRFVVATVPRVHRKRASCARLAGRQHHATRPPAPRGAQCAAGLRDIFLRG